MNLKAKMMNQRGIAFYWENLGPMHVDRILAVCAGRPSDAIHAIELSSKSAVYDWDRDSRDQYRRYTLFSAAENPSLLRKTLRLVRECINTEAKAVFLCNYNEVHVFLAAIALRLMGRKVFVMGDSKFDDYSRHLWREVLKSIFLLPYCGALSSAWRAKDYLRFLGVRRVVGEYNTVSLDRIRSNANSEPAPGGIPFSKRSLVCIARLVAKKNLFTLLDAYSVYRDITPQPRNLVLCGSGVLEVPLKEAAARLGISEHVEFRGFIQAEAVAEVLAQGLLLLLPSVEEQYGNVVIEAQAMGLPVIVSDNVGARDLLVRSGVNGFVVEPDNPKGMAFFAMLISKDETLWRQMSNAAREAAPRADVGRFVDGVIELVP